MALKKSRLNHNLMIETYLFSWFLSKKIVHLRHRMTLQMVKNIASQEPKAAKNIQKILITQARPESEKSPYFEMARKFNVKLDFHPFIRVEGIPAKEFRKQKVEIANYSAVIFTSR